jgi:RNA 3'-terminal phosphate cyclase (ATP)
MGVRAEAEIVQPGFYPAGGGKINIKIEPPDRLAPLYLDSFSVEDVHCRATAVCADLADHIGVRELATIKKKLKIAEQDTELICYSQYGPGNVVSIFVKSDQLTETFVGFGQKNIRAERVAARIVGQVRNYLEVGAVVGPYLADQLLVPMALAGKGQFLTCKPTGHTLTNIEVIHRFLDIEIMVSRVDDKVWRISL